MNKPLLALSLIPLALAACTPSDIIPNIFSSKIQLDQCGYMPNAEKMALLSAPGSKFSIINSSYQEVYHGNVAEPQYWAEAGDTVRQIVFSDLVTPDKYFILVDDSLISYPFVIADTVYNAARAATLKAYYYNRASMAITPQYGGQWARPAGHPDDSILVHKSAASTQRPEGTVLSMPGGWYDAGDYNKYIVNSSITTYTLMLAARLYPNAAKNTTVNIPESGNGLPDIVNELLYNLRWMMTMQDPNDGGVYHKLTTLSFEGFIMPADCHKTRYVVQKSTAAALDFSSTMAFAARTLPLISDSLKPLADSCKAQAQYAYQWALAHPDVIFANPADISTGDYADHDINDEWLWASTEMFLTFNDDRYSLEAQKHKGSFSVPEWRKVGTLAYFSMLIDNKTINGFDPRAAVTAMADTLLAIEANSPAQLSRISFDWGSNSFIANDAMLKLVLAKTGAPNAQKLEASALNDLHYILGRNAVGYSFLTGIGTHPAMHIHHRPSAADGINDPIPGFLAGGPNTRVPTDCGSDSPRSTFPAAAYADQECSYSTNEIAINWNAPLLFLLLALTD